MSVPNEILLIIYDLCDKPDRINMNRAFNWDYKSVNPFKDHKFLSINTLTEYGNSQHTFLTFYMKVCVYPFPPYYRYKWKIVQQYLLS
jgi:hypothetical protein